MPRADGGLCQRTTDGGTEAERLRGGRVGRRLVQALVERPVLGHQRGRPAPRRLLLGHQRVGGEQQAGDGRAVLPGRSEPPAAGRRSPSRPCCRAGRTGRRTRRRGRARRTRRPPRRRRSPRWRRSAWPARTAPGGRSRRRSRSRPVTSASPSVTLRRARRPRAAAPTPPPATMPSAIAARVADSASSTRCRSSFSSAEVGAPTRITATRPDSAPIRSVSTSSSMPNVARSSSARICAEPELDRLGRPAAADDRGAVGVDPHLAGPAEVLDRHRLEREPGVLAVDGAAGERGDVLQLVQPPVAEAGRAHRHALEDPVDVVVHQHRQRAALDVLGDDDQRPRVRMTLSSSGMSCWTLVIFSLQSRM